MAVIMFIVCLFFSPRILGFSQKRLASTEGQATGREELIQPEEMIIQQGASGVWRPNELQRDYRIISSGVWADSI